jgi:hypothetical protein
MSHPHPCFRRARHFRCAALILSILALTRAARAQEHDEDHDHDHEHLHFSHPLVTESPTPDTKLRFDFLSVRSTDAGSDRENVLQLEGEYAFGHALSLSVITPYVWITSAGNTLSNLGDIQISLKGASMIFAERGILIGGGLSTTLPTGSEEKGIGSGHVIELEPFVDAAYKHDALELVSFLSTSSALNRRSGDQDDRSLSLDASALYALASRMEALFEVATTRALVGPATGSWQTLVALGIKVYPIPNRKCMVGASVGFGTREIQSTRTVLMSAFYHF